MSDYTTIQVVRATIGSDVAGTADEVLARLITAVSRQIDRACNRPDGFVAAAVPSAREYAGTGAAVLSIDECLTVTLVEARHNPADASYLAWGADDWRAFSGDALTPDFTRTPFTALMTLPSGDHPVFPSGIFSGWSSSRAALSELPLRQWSVPTVRVTARWGYAESIPEDIANACVIQVARMFKRGKSGYADTLASADMGTLQYRKLDPEVEAILRQGRYIRAVI